MSDFELSKYQKDILDCIENKNGNLLVEAKAGSGKTSTLLIIAKEIFKQNKKCLFLAFNKHIVQELENKIQDDRCQIKTLHALGLSFLRSYLFRKYGKNYDIVIGNEHIKEYIKFYFEELCLQEFTEANEDLSSEEFRDLKSDVLSELYLMINFVRYYNVNYHDRNKVIQLGKDFNHALCRYYDIGMNKYPEIIEILVNKIKEDFENPILVNNVPTLYIDYTDMIYFPVYYRMYPPFNLKPYLDYVLVDECIPGDVYVTTNKGKKKLKTLYSLYNRNKLGGIKVKTFNEELEQFEYKDIFNVKCKGTKDIYEVTTYGLNKMTATDNHPFLTQNGWKRLDELIPDEDYIYLDNTYNQKCKLIPNNDQLQVIYGTALGDGHLTKGNSKEYRLRISHSEKQYDYFKFKKDLLQCNYENMYKGGYEAKSKIYVTATRQFILDIKDKKDIINKLDARGLAILYMDDGSCAQKYPYSTIHISCNNFNEEETQCLINKFKEYGIETENYPHINQYGKKYNELKMNSENGHLFLKLIAPYMISSCFYKNPESTGTYIWNNKFKEFGGNIIKSIRKLEPDIVYDMEVKDNHNFLVSMSSTNSKGSNFIVHNCQDLSILQQCFLKLLNDPMKRTRYIAVGDRRPGNICFCRS